MPDVLIYADTVRSPAMRHEVPILVPDPFLYVERDGARHTVSTSFEVDRIAAIPGGPQAHASEEYGFDDLIAQRLPREEVDLGVVVNACKAFGVEKAVAPPTFPIAVAERLWQSGIQVTSDREIFAARRRVKNEAELAGIRRAQRAAEAGMDAARDLLRRAEPNGSGLVVDGEPLTAERLKDAINTAFVAHRVVAEDFIVAPGAQGAVGHDLGSGPIAAGQSVVIDLWPRTRNGLLRGHDPHLRRRRTAGGARGVPPAREGCPRPGARDHAGGDPGDGSVPGWSATCSRRRATRRSSRRGPARC